jgi:hypothetical protein
MKDARPSPGRASSSNRSLTFLTAEPQAENLAPDVLDAGIRSRQTLDDVVASSSPISRRWGIVTTLKPEDFAEALRGARAATAAGTPSMLVHA